MSDFDLFRLFKLIHVVAVIGLGSGIVLESVIGPMMPRAKSVGELRVLAGLSRIGELFVILPSMVVLFIFGNLAVEKGGYDHSATWVAMGQILFFVALALVLFVELRASLKLNKTLVGVADGPVPPELQSQMKNPLPAIGGALLTVIYVFIAYLMVVKPGW